MLTRTTITIPENLLQQLKMQAVLQKTSVSTMITDMIHTYLYKNPHTAEKKKTKSVIGSLHIGIGKIYTNRSELYEEHLKHKMGI